MKISLTPKDKRGYKNLTSKFTSKFTPEED